jgi:glucose-6-phosphate 1-dehydrogenase
MPPSESLSLIERKQPLSIVVIGASGDLSMRKILPALFALYCQHRLPEKFHIVGFARSEISNDAFRDMVRKNLACRYSLAEDCEKQKDKFLQHCTYTQGEYDQAESYRKLHEELRPLEPEGKENRIFYLSIPPFLFLDVARALAQADLVHREQPSGWSRVVVEKPFGSDRETSDELTSEMGKVFDEQQTYRIDHYLGKEVIQNLMVLRFANLIFDPVWNRRYVHSVSISWTEQLGLEGRAGYFDKYGIIRDVMQNHLLQILALVSMEQPVAYEAGYIRDEKVKALRSVPAVEMKNLVVGQYTAGGGQIGYLEEPGIPRHSITPTFSAAVLHVQNRRWDGVPFLIRAGKAMNTSMTEIVIRFQNVPGNIFAKNMGHLSSNQLRIRVQPDAGISLRIVNKEPGLRMSLNDSVLDLSYASAFDEVIPDAYESLILDVIRGDGSLFIRGDELEAAWDIFTPVLHELDETHVKPRGYPLGGTGPEAAQQLAARYGITW